MNQMVSHKDRVNGLKSLLENNKGKLAEALPKHLNADRLIKTALIAANKTPKLLQCTNTSVFESLMTAAELGLNVSGTLGSAYLIPYKDKCTLIVGYRGLIDLARRSGQISTIEAHVVYENDDFEISFGLDAKLNHTPNLDGDRGKMKLVYAIAVLVDGAKQCEVMTKEDVDRIRASSMGKNSGPWKDHYDEMAKKTVVRRLMKYLPLSPELERSLSLDAEAETPTVIRDIDDLGAPQSAGTEGVKAALAEEPLSREARDP